MKRENWRLETNWDQIDHGGEEEEGGIIVSMSLSRLGVKAKLCDSSAISKYLKTY